MLCVSGDQGVLHDLVAVFVSKGSKLYCNIQEMLKKK